jgi:hypothetical protein
MDAGTSHENVITFLRGYLLAARQRVTRTLIVATIACALTMACASAVSTVVQNDRMISAAERIALIRRAQVWSPTSVAAADLLNGPPDAPFTHGETITCDYVDAKFGGHTPKFGCTLDGRHVLKVRFGRDNGEVYAGVAATRLLWALGFGVDSLYPVHAVCRDCPNRLASDGISTRDGIEFDVAAVEHKFPGEDVEAHRSLPGWAWPELSIVDPSAGGAPLAHRDALKLLAVLIQHSDNKAEQQRLVCRSPAHSSRELAACDDPFLAIHDLGQTFGRANRLNRSSVSSGNLALWSNTPIWKDRARCVANLARSATGTLSDPVISEAGRKFLADLLTPLSDRQLRDLFLAARLDDKPHGGGPIDAWVTAFKHKREEIASASCP